MTYVFFLCGYFFACSSEENSIKEDTKMRLWSAKNTVLLFEPCHQDLKLKEDSSEEEIALELAKQKSLCEKFHSKKDQLLSWCSKEIPESFANPQAPNGDEEFTKAKSELLKICSVVLETEKASKE